MAETIEVALTVCDMFPFDKFTFSWDFGATTFGSQVSGYVWDAKFVWRNCLKFEFWSTIFLLYVCETRTCCKAISCRVVFAVFPINRECQFVQWDEICGRSDSLSRPPCLWSRLDDILVQLLSEEQLWNIHVWSKHSSCLRCNTVVNMPDITGYSQSELFLMCYICCTPEFVFSDLPLQIYHSIFSKLQ